MMSKAAEDALRNPTVDVRTAARLLGLSDSGAYRAAARGDIPTVRIGGAVRIPSRWLERVLLLDEPEAAK